MEIKKKKLPVAAVLTIEPKSSSYFIGEFVTFKCDMNEGRDTDWYYAINKDGRDYVRYSEYKVYTLEMRSTDRSGKYQCYGSSKWSDYTKNSNTVSVTVLGKSSVINNVMTPCDFFRPKNGQTFEISLTMSEKIKMILNSGTTIIPVGGSVTLTCSLQSSDGWKYEWFRRTQTTYEGKIRDQQNRDIRVSEGGIYSCIGTRGNPVYYTYESDDVTIEKTSDLSPLCVMNFQKTKNRKKLTRWKNLLLQTNTEVMSVEIQSGLNVWAEDVAY
uniref:Ig-like domain-containing protein n=1 Tax=Astatotilapia calliptera TaxID=8154 RepID=A0A3P8NHT3_ASTCA